MISYKTNPYHNIIHSIRQLKSIFRLRRNPAFSLLFLLFGLTLIILETTAHGGSQEKNTGTPAATLSYPLAAFEDGKARHYQYKTPGGQTIRYFLIKSSDGVVRAAFDACDVCWPSNKGYVQEGQYMICRNCGRKFPTSQINVVTGGCNPAALPRQLTKTHIILRVQDILAGRKYFTF